MNKQEFDAWQKRIETRADELWERDGKPEGARDGYLEIAREQIAIAENPTSGQRDPKEAAKPVEESLVSVINQGEFPTMTDQGDEQLFPDERDGEDRKKTISR